jgi:hypothetical protein
MIFLFHLSYVSWTLLPTKRIRSFPVSSLPSHSHLLWDQREAKQIIISVVSKPKNWFGCTHRDTSISYCSICHTHTHTHTHTKVSNPKTKVFLCSTLYSIGWKKKSVCRKISIFIHEIPVTVHNCILQHPSVVLPQDKMWKYVFRKTLAYSLFHSENLCRSPRSPSQVPALLPISVCDKVQTIICQSRSEAKSCDRKIIRVFLFL